jgi:hypothetical protein
MKSLTRLCVLLLLSFQLFANDHQGGQYKQLGHWQVHYIAFPSTFIQPKIASAYGLKRSNYKAIVNVSVLSKNTNLKALKAQLTGTAKNLLGNKQNLDFKEVVEGDSIYYLAQIDFNNEETFRFNIQVQQANTAHTLTFQQKFYVD